MDSRRIERAAAEWLARRDSGWGDTDQAEFDAWLAESTAHRVAWLRLNAAWQRSDRLKALGAGLPPGQVPERGRYTRPSLNTPVAEDATAVREEKSSRSHRWRHFATAAAALVLTASAAWVWWLYGAEEQARYYTGLGSMQEILLADGSQATLGSASHMEVTVSRNRRRVDLEQGEAYFNVVHDPGRTFEVHAAGRRVVAVGTRFSVRRDAGDLRVVVTDGAVRLDSGVTSSSELLTAGMVAHVDNGRLRVREYSVDQAEELLSWRDGFLVFRDTPLSEAAAEFNRYSTRKLVIADAAIADIPIGGNFRWSNTDAFVRLLEQGFGVHSEQRGNEIILSGLPAAP